MVKTMGAISVLAAVEVAVAEPAPGRALVKQARNLRSNPSLHQPIARAFRANP